MWFIFSILALLCWSGSDLFSKMGTNPKDKYSHLRLIIMVGFVMGLHAVIYMIANDVKYDPINLIRYLPVSALYILSMTLGYIGLRYIELSVSSPICNSSGAIVAILCFFFLGDTLNGLQIAAVALICGGIIFLAALEKRKDSRQRLSAGIQDDRKYTHSFLALLFPIAYCIIDALGSFADALVLDGETPLFTEIEANLSYEFTFLICAVAAYIFLVFVKKQKFNVIKEKIFGIGAICETAGQFFYVFAMAAKPVAAAPVIGSYCVVSVIWSRIFLKEKLPKIQYAAVAIVISGIIILGIVEGLAELA